MVQRIKDKAQSVSVGAFCALIGTIIDVRLVVTVEGHEMVADEASKLQWTGHRFRAAICVPTVSNIHEGDDSSKLIDRLFDLRHRRLVDEAVLGPYACAASATFAARSSCNNSKLNKAGGVRLLFKGSVPCRTMTT